MAIVQRVVIQPANGFTSTIEPPVGHLQLVNADFLTDDIQFANPVRGFQIGTAGGIRVRCAATQAIATYKKGADSTITIKGGFDMLYNTGAGTTAQDLVALL